MDEQLRKQLQSIEKHIGVLKSAEEKYLSLDAHSEVLYSKLFLSYLTGTVEERKAKAKSSEAWMDFSKGLAIAHAEYNEERRKYELKLKAYDGLYLTYKIENSTIKRQF